MEQGSQLTSTLSNQYSSIESAQLFKSVLIYQIITSDHSLQNCLLDLCYFLIFLKKTNLTTIS